MEKDIQESLIVDSKSRSPFAEAFRVMRTNIKFAELENPYGIILITSTGPGEGKSTNAANLGVVMAQANHKVLIVDCDLRRPTLHKIFKLNKSVGVTNVLLDDLDPSDLAQETEIPGLYILPSGPIPPNPAELVGSQRMQVLLTRAKEKFDYVLVDSPPIIAVTDATLLSTLVDGVLLVVKKGFTRTELVKEAKAKLEKIGANIIGVILNKVNISGADYYYYYYYQGVSADESKMR